MEIWKDIDGYEGLYQVSNLGRVKSLSRMIPVANKSPRRIEETILKQTRNNGRYYHVGLSSNKKYKSCSVARLVGKAFVPNPDPANKIYINHINEIITDNRAENLEWTTPKENTNHGTRNERLGKMFWKPINQYTMQGEFVKRWDSAKEAITALNMGKTDICNCCKGNQKSAKGFKWRYAEQ